MLKEEKMSYKFSMLLLVFCLVVSNAWSEDKIRVGIVDFSFEALISNMYVLNESEHKKLFENTKEEIKKIGDKKGNLSFTSLDIDNSGPNTLFFDLLTPIDERKYSVDLFVMAGMTEDCQKIRVSLIGARSTRHYSKDIDLQAINIKDFSKIVGNEVAVGLNYINEILKVYADGVINVEDSVVYYTLPTVENVNVRLAVNYDSLHEFIQNVEFSIPGTLNDGTHKLFLRTQHKDNIGIILNILNNKVVSYDVFTSFIPVDNNIDSVTFKVVSLEDYKINFIAIWGNGEFLKINISPEQNPYLPHGITKLTDSKELIPLNGSCYLNYGCEGEGDID
jgi:hypothetical protein